MKNNNVDQLIKAYQTTVSLITYEGSLVWSRFNTIFGAQAILFVIIGWVIQQNNNQIAIVNQSNGLIVGPMSFFGLILCFLWFQMTSRGFAFLHYLTLTGRQLEDGIDNDKIKTLYYGDHFRKNRSIKFSLKEDGQTKTVYFTRPWYSQIIRTETAAYILILIFVIVYLFLLILSLTTIRW